MDAQTIVIGVERRAGNHERPVVGRAGDWRRRERQRRSDHQRAIQQLHR
jgi:hypothetical protein